MSEYALSEATDPPFRSSTPDSTATSPSVSDVLSRWLSSMATHAAQAVRPWVLWTRSTFQLFAIGHPLEYRPFLASDPRGRRHRPRRAVGRPAGPGRPHDRAVRGARSASPAPLLPVHARSQTAAMGLSASLSAQSLTIAPGDSGVCDVTVRNTG